MRAEWNLATGLAEILSTSVDERTRSVEKPYCIARWSFRLLPQSEDQSISRIRGIALHVGLREVRLG